MRLGIAHHFGWAVAVTAAADHSVVDRRRIELVGPGVSIAPIHHYGGPRGIDDSGVPLSDASLYALLAALRWSVNRAISTAFDELAAALPERIESISLRTWSQNFPKDIAVKRRPPYEAQADSVMYREVLAEEAMRRGWRVHLYDAKKVEAQAAAMLGERADEVLRGPRAKLGPPWNKDHRMALAATIVAG